MVPRTYFVGLYDRYNIRISFGLVNGFEYSKYFYLYKSIIVGKINK